MDPYNHSSARDSLLNLLRLRQEWRIPIGSLDDNSSTQVISNYLLGDTEMLSSARSKICPTCQSTARTRVRRRFWMRLSPFSKHYLRNTCGRQFIYVSLLSVLTTFFMGILFSLLAILADPLGIGGQQGFGVKPTVLLGIGIGLSALGSFFAFVKYCLERLT